MTSGRPIGARYPVLPKKGLTHSVWSEGLDPDCDSRLEEFASALTHGAGIGLSIAALVMLTINAAALGSGLAVISVILYSVTLIFLFASSTLYHSFRPGRAKAMLLTTDHIGIFLLIAGTYTPITLVVMSAGDRWILFAIIWGLAAAGIALRLFVWRYLHPLFLLIYLAMGWLGFAFSGPISSGLGKTGLELILIGGLFYTAGLGFYAWRTLAFNHALWHLSVLTGAIFHFFAMIYHVVPYPAG